MFTAANSHVQPQRYASGTQTGTNAAPVETNNILSHPVGPEHQLVVGEGTYILRNDLLLSIPPPHPSDAPPTNPNPLATTIGPPTAGTKLSIFRLSSSNNTPTHALYRSSIADSTGSPGAEGSHNGSTEQETEISGSSRRSNGIELAGLASPFPVPVFGEGNTALNVVNGKEQKDATKKRKPKNNIVKSNSSFVSRVITHDLLSKKLQDRPADGFFAFANINRAFQWLDLSSESVADPLTKVLFTKAHALCHDVNLVTKSTSHVDVVMGFSTSDLIWYEPMTQKYARLNKNGIINPSAVSSIYWMPNSENLFLAAHMDGTLIVYDKEKDDAPFAPEEPTDDTSAQPGLQNGYSSKLKILKSVQSSNQKTNPVAAWKISNLRINSFAFSPDCQHLAVVSEDGTLRILDFLEERLLDLYMSYYGGMTCVCWSPDGRYIVTGGQDDLVSIWSLSDGVLVARCQGHNSWVTGVAFDAWRCDERNYRFGSIGEDGRLLLWDFNVSMVHRPRAASIRPMGSVSGPPSSRSRGDGDPSRLNSYTSFNDGTDAEDEDLIVHPVEARARTAMLPPVMAKQIGEHPLSWLQFEEEFITTACRNGHIRTWNRPVEGGQQRLSMAGTSSTSSNP